METSPMIQKRTNATSGETVTTGAEHVTVNLTMPLDRAREVTWRGRGPREPMGRLLDEGIIDTGDLTWAIDKHDNQEVREAARTLLAHWLGEPKTLQATQRHGPKVYSGGS